jgi:hypothetical protein
MAQEVGQRIASRTVPAEAPVAQKFTFILFWKEDNAATQTMAAALKSALATRADRATWAGVNVADPANQALVERYKVSRAPMPMVLCVAPNGAITGGFPKGLTDDAIEGALVTPSMTQCMKALQEGKIVVVHVKTMPNAALPSGANDFAADPAYQARTSLVSFTLNDPAEGRFLKDMEINPAAVKGSIVSVLAPPGVLVGKFAANVTKDQIAAELHAAGKCCDDPNCVHNQKAK